MKKSIVQKNIHIKPHIYTVVAVLTGGGGTNVGRATDLSEGAWNKDYNRRKV